MQEKIQIIKALKNPSADPKMLKMRIRGTKSKIRINIKKLHEAIEVEDCGEEESNQNQEEEKFENKIEVDISEEDEKFVVAKIADFKLEKTKRNTITKESMISMMKLIGDFAKFKSKDISKAAQ